MNARQSRRAFTFVELVLVVLILGVLAGVALPYALGNHKNSLTAATVQQLRTIALAAEVYRNEQGEWPADGVSGQIPPGMERDLRPNLFAVPCPIGGAYDWDRGVDSRAAQLKVVSASEDRAAWLLVDERIDDGNLSTGDLRYESAGGGHRIVWVLEE